MDQIFNYLRTYRTKYDKLTSDYQKQADVLRGIGTNSAARCLREITEKYDDAVTDLRRNARQNFHSRTKSIADPDMKKRLRYHGNLWINRTDQCPVCKTAAAFYEWCGIDQARASPQEIDKTNQRKGG